MKVLFCQSVQYPFIGVMSLSAVLKQDGHEVSLKIFNLRRVTQNIYREILDFAPDIIAIPVYTGWHRSAIKFCNFIKSKIDVHIVLGGPHPTYYPDIINEDCVDFICVGEGEIAFQKLVNGLAKNISVNNIPGIWLKNEGIIVDNGLAELPNLNELPFADADIYFKSNKQLREMKHREFSTIRGCVYKCSYCVNKSLNNVYDGKAIRSKNPQQVIDEIKYFRYKYPFSSITFVNDTLFFNKVELQNFLLLYKSEINLPYFCNLRIEMINEDIVAMLRNSGCAFVAVGVESGSPRVRSEILNRHMTNEKILSGIKMLKDNGIGVNANSMVGIPGETFEEAMQTVYLIQEAQPTTTWCSIFQPYPGTDLTNHMLETGGMTVGDFDSIPASFFDKSIIKKMDIHKFVNLQRFFNICVNHPRLVPFVKYLCQLKVGRLYDIFFLCAFYSYLRKAHKESFFSSVKIILKNSMAALDA